MSVSFVYSRISKTDSLTDTLNPISVRLLHIPHDLVNHPTDFLKIKQYLISYPYCWRGGGASEAPSGISQMCHFQTAEERELKLSDF